MARCFLVALASLALASAEDCQEDEQGTCSTHLLQAQADRRTALHPWPTFRGRSQTAAVGQAPPKDLSTPSWSWQHPRGQFHTIVSGGPVIDKDSNLYLQTAQGIRKFTSSGKEVWIFETPGLTNNEPSLYGNLLLSSTKLPGLAYAVDRVTGKELWKTYLADSSGGDCGYPAAHNGVFVVGANMGNDTRIQGGNTKVFGLDTNTGKQLWEYDPDHVVWNLSPLFPDDESVVFMDFTGGMYKLSLTTGQELWKTPAPNSDPSFSDGGPSLGQNGKVYACSNYGVAMGQEGSLGVARAFDLLSGQIVWEKILSSPCNSFPAVGHVRGSDRLAAVFLPGPFDGTPNVEGSVLALDAETGEEIWKFNTENYTSPMNQAAGDLEGLIDRTTEGIQTICAPAHWSAPTIDGSGTVYGLRLNGKLYAVHGPQETVDTKELKAALVLDSSTGVVAEVYPIGSASLHGAMAWAPGLYAFSTCDTLQVFHTK
mmetsp:Transcript_98368/g.234168  ORF Transcript_98368/g.234168 Transcript_98368/m.234168 type:complete len:483 (-) Transcript_98368:63-1511(-)|eukprot:CAMPEP_0181414018 /NCGR_PEP_ID=MMETSP1110-20121109/9283_1 /TAXON_ID=174948 /ORGANISM="Symbiodinium sp., Strain CCMP421" /LENGTH=482 /DNA_ID=CAMNT_0023536873 /DNA_START=80 /DNA_END=1528 /DNA_ORIENTATION=-